MTESLPNVPHGPEPANLAQLFEQRRGALSPVGAMVAEAGIDTLAQLLGAKTMDDWPHCPRRWTDPDSNACGAVLLAKVDDAHNRHIHYCDTDVKALHPEHQVMVNTEHAAEVAHRCVCGVEWVENTGAAEAEQHGEQA